MPISHTELETALKRAFSDAEIVLTDLAGDEDHWQAEITSALFVGKNRIAQQRMVMDAVKDYDIHALSIRTKMPKEQI